MHAYHMDKAMRRVFRGDSFGRSLYAEILLLLKIRTTPAVYSSQRHPSHPA